PGPILIAIHFSVLLRLLLEGGPKKMKRGFQFLLIHLVMLVAMVGWVSAQQNSDSSASADNPLVKLLQSKGIITEQEALMVNSASSRTESDERLARLLLSKGLISREEYDQTIIASTADAAGKPRAVPASLNAADAVTAGSATETAAQPANASIAKSTSKPGDGSAKGSSQGQPQSEGLMTTLSKVRSRSTATSCLTPTGWIAALTR